MWNFVGIVRTTKRLERAKRRIDMLRQEVSDYYRHFRVTPDLIELRNLLEVADLIVQVGPVAPRKPRAALHARLSRAGRRSSRYGVGALAPRSATGGRPSPGRRGVSAAQLPNEAKRLSLKSLPPR
jgi:hypothetical protein